MESLTHQNPQEPMQGTHGQRTPMVKGQKRVRPAWSQWNFESEHKAKTVKPVKCGNCGTVAIPLAHQHKRKFCTFACGKEFLRKRAETEATDT